MQGGVLHLGEGEGFGINRAGNVGAELPDWEQHLRVDGGINVPLLGASHGSRPFHTYLQEKLERDRQPVLVLLEQVDVPALLGQRHQQTRGGGRDVGRIVSSTTTGPVINAELSGRRSGCSYPPPVLPQLQQDGGVVQGHLQGCGGRVSYSGKAEGGSPEKHPIQMPVYITRWINKSWVVPRRPTSGWLLPCRPTWMICVTMCGWSSCLVKYSSTPMFVTPGSSTLARCCREGKVRSVRAGAA